MKIIFAGTPDIALKPLQALIDSEHEVVAVYTQPDRPAGRGQQLSESPVKKLALANHLTVMQPGNFKDEADITTLKRFNADLMVVMAYGLIVPLGVLQAPKFGCINIHVSLLPKWRGAAPIQHAILAGDSETGITIMQMDTGLDTGAILHQINCPIFSDDTSITLFERLADMSPHALMHTLSEFETNTVNPRAQDNSLSSYATKIQKHHAKIDWEKPAIEIERMIRAYIPHPVAYSEVDNNRVRIWAATIVTGNSHHDPGIILKADQNGIIVQTGKDQLCITELQLPGKKTTQVREILNAYKQRFAPGQPL